MIIERFFGKGRAGQPESQPEPAKTPNQPAPTQRQKSSRVQDKDEPKPRRAPSATAGSETPVRRSEPTEVPASRARSAGPALATPPAGSRKAGTLSPEPSYEEIAARAYDLWAAQGRPEGRDHENWIEAERQLRAERARS